VRNEDQASRLGKHPYAGYTVSLRSPRSGRGYPAEPDDLDESALGTAAAPSDPDYSDAGLDNEPPRTQKPGNSTLPVTPYYGPSPVHDWRPAAIIGGLLAVAVVTALITTLPINSDDQQITAAPTPAPAVETGREVALPAPSTGPTVRVSASPAPAAVTAAPEQTGHVTHPPRQSSTARQLGKDRERDQRPEHRSGQDRLRPLGGRPRFHKRFRHRWWPLRVRPVAPA
jgi:hypothetical protein